MHKTQEKEWLIWSVEHTSWWSPDRLGYTSDLEKAGLYSYDEAIDILRDANIDIQRDNFGYPNEAMVHISTIKND